MGFSNTTVGDVETIVVPFTNMNLLLSQHGKVITSIIKGAKLPINSQKSTAQWMPLNLKLELISNFIPYFIGRAITYPWWD